MPSSGLATMSNLTLVLAIATYAVAMLAYACDFMFARFRGSATAATGAGGAGDVASAAATADATAASDLSGLSFPADPADMSQLADVRCWPGGTTPRNPPDAASGTAGGSGPSGSGVSPDDRAPGGTVSPLASTARVGTASAVLTVAPDGPAQVGVTTAGSGQPQGHPALDWSGATRSRWPAGMWLRVAFGLTCAGALVHVIAILTRGLAEHRIPWGNMYEFIAAFTCAAVLTLIAASIRFRAYYMGLFVMLPVVLALAVDVLVIYTPAGSLVPALQSYWIAIHVTGMIISIGMFVFGTVVTVMYLLVARHEGQAAAGDRASAGGVLSQLPGAATLDRLAYRAILFAFPAWTFAIIAGAIWADQAWGRYWGWDPKETWSFITWLVYAAYLHARATAGWRGRRAAYIQLFGFVCLMFNLVGINLWVTGLHSYAGL